MADERGSALLMAGAFLAGVAAGVVLAWMLESPEPAVPRRELAAEGARHGPEGGGMLEATSGARPALHPGGRPPEARGPEPDAVVPPPDKPFEPAPDLELPPGVAGWIRVEIVPPPGDPSAYAEAYVLPAGAPGVEDEDVLPHRSVSGEEPGTIAVDRPGHYDVGIAWNDGHLLRRDVTVIAGETTTVVFQFPTARGVRLTLDDPLPTVAEGTVLVQVRLHPVTTRNPLSFPGRGQTRSRSRGGNLVGGTGTIGRLLEGERVRVEVQLWHQVLKPKAVWRRFEGHAAICTPQLAGPGDDVRVSVVPASRVRMRFLLDLASWPEGVEREMELTLQHVGGVHVETYSIDRTPRWKETDCFQWDVPVPAGPVRISWRGHEIEPGSRGGVTAEAGQRVEIEARLRYLGRARFIARPVRVEVAWPKQLDGDDELSLAGLFRPGGDRAEMSTWSIEKEDDPEREARLRAAAGFVGVIGRAWATGPLAPPAGDVWRIRPVRGGLLVVTPEFDRPESMGRFVLRRADGLPIPRPEEGFERELRVTTGLVIGPFVPGEHTFQVWLGRSRLPDAKAMVRAGRTAPLVIR